MSKKKKLSDTKQITGDNMEYHSLCNKGCKEVFYVSGLSNPDSNSNVSFIKWKKDDKGKEFCWAFKVYRKDSDNSEHLLYSPFYKAFKGIGGPGPYFSGRYSEKLTPAEIEAGSVKTGYQVVFTNNLYNLLSVFICNSHHVGTCFTCVRVKCYREDFVASGSFAGMSFFGIIPFDSAVFTSLEITEQEWKRIWKRGREDAVVA